jgi:hypothetical protein
VVDFKPFEIRAHEESSATNRSTVEASGSAETNAGTGGRTSSPLARRVGPLAALRRNQASAGYSKPDEGRLLFAVDFAAGRFLISCCGKVAAAARSPNGYRGTWGVTCAEFSLRAQRHAVHRRPCAPDRVAGAGIATVPRRSPPWRGQSVSLLRVVLVGRRTVRRGGPPIFLPRESAAQARRQTYGISRPRRGGGPAARRRQSNLCANW